MAAERGATLHGRLLDVAERFPAREAFVDEQGRATFVELAGRVRALAGRFRSQGLSPGQRVAILLPNGIAYVECLFASVLAGCVAAPLDPRLKARELRAILAKVGPSAVVAESASPASDITSALGAAPDPVPAGGSTFFWKSEDGWNVTPPDSRRPPAGSSEGSDSVSSDVAVTFASSGTSGVPKTILHTHRSLTASLLDLGPDQLTWMTTAPLCTMAGHTVMTQALLGGHRLVTMKQFHPRKALELVERERVSILAASPTTLGLMLRVEGLSRRDLSSLLFVGVGGGPTPPRLAGRAKAAFPCPVIISYGSTELGGPVLATHGNDSEEVATETVGRPLAGREVRVVDDGGRDVGPGVVGELVCRSVTTMAGYESAGLSGEKWLPGRWFRTGDLAVLAADGNVRIVGRKDDVIIRAEQNILPLEVEEVLESHPAVEKAAVVGIPRSTGGEEVYAFVAPKDAAVPAHELLAHCRRELASYKVPDRIRFCRDLPCTADGAVRRFLLVEMLAGEAKSG